MLLLQQWTLKRVLGIALQRIQPVFDLASPTATGFQSELCCKQALQMQSRGGFPGEKLSWSIAPMEIDSW